jgi:hypothetical protein
MKTFVKMLMCLACMALLASCEKDPDFSGSANLGTLKNFDAGFIVYDNSEENAPVTSEGCLKTWRGEGESAVFGQFTVEMTLLCDMDNLTFCNLIGTFHAADGSALFFSIAEGEIAYNQGTGSEVYQYSFNNLAIISGGTGRFAGASGNFKPNAMIHNGELPNWFAKFSCKGDIKLNSGNQSEVGPLIPEPLP